MTEGGISVTRTRPAHKAQPRSAADAHTRQVSQTPRRRRGSGTVSLVLGIVLLVIGLGVLLFPLALDVADRARANDAIEEMRTTAIGDAAVTQVQGADGQTYRSKENDAAYDELVAYNAAVRAGTGDAINDPFAFQADELDSFDLPDGILGSVSIPKLGVKMTLYLGATTENMEHGAAVIAGTSIPLGEQSSNTVIAAHRGGPYGHLRNIEDLEPGDQVIVETPWDKLVYTVSSMEIILPTQTDAAGLGIEEGRDMVTLYTCHPYGVSSHRLLVHCDYDPNATAEADPSPLAGAVLGFIPHNLSSDSPLLNAEAVLKLVALVLLILCAALLIARAVRARRSRREERDMRATVTRPPDLGAGGRHFR